LPPRHRCGRAVSQPSARTLRQFALLCLLFCLAAAEECWRRGFPDWCTAGCGLAALVSLPGLFFPALTTPLFSGLMWGTTPVRWLTSRLLLFSIYVAVVFPIGLLRRLLGHDSLQLRSEDRHTYWKSRSDQASSALRPW